jgi:hypothetical protein
MYDFDRWNRIASEALERGSSTDEILAELRAAGATPVPSMKVLCSTAGMGLGEAKRLVWSSPVWADELPAHLGLEDELLAALDVETEGFDAE